MTPTTAPHRPRGRRTLTTLLMALGTAATCQADLIDLEFDGTGAGRRVLVEFEDSERTVFAGQLLHESSNATGSIADIDGLLTMFCIDFTEGVDRSVRTFKHAPFEELPLSVGQRPMGPDTAEVLVDIFYGANSGPADGVDENDHWSATQLALWEIVSDYDPEVGAASLDLSSGRFQARAPDGEPLGTPIADIFDELIGNNLGRAVATRQVLGFASEGAQDQIFFNVPAPATAMVFGGVGLMAMRRRRG